MSYENLKEFYLTKEEAVEALANYNYGRPYEKQLFYIPYFDEWQNRKVYIICEREFFYFWRNERRKERLQNIREGRCKVPSDKYGVKRCNEDCKHCPYKQDSTDPEKEVTDYTWTGNALSLDKPVGYQDDGDPIYIDVPDDSPTILEKLIQEDIKNERRNTVSEALKELSEVDRAIITLYYAYSKSDAEISNVVNVPRATVQRRRIKAFEYLKKLFQKNYKKLSKK